jgi:hypothetical protein
MWTSLLSDRDRAAFRRGAVGALFGAVVPIAIASGGSAVSSADAKKLADSVRAQVAGSDQFPIGPAPSVRWLIRPARTTADGDRLIVGVVQIRFQGLVNSYCRLVATKDEANATAVLIQLPESANHDTCKSVRSPHLEDLDNDGRADYSFTVKVRSNRYPTDVEEVLVFLGQPHKAAPFCFSSAASRAVAPAVSSSAKWVKSALADALKRGGKTHFDCDSPGR